MAFRLLGLTAIKPLAPRGKDIVEMDSFTPRWSGTLDAACYKLNERALSARELIGDAGPAVILSRLIPGHANARGNRPPR